MAITKIQSGALPADVITTAAIDDASVTHAKLHTTMDLSSKTVTLPTLSTLNITGNVGIGTSSPSRQLHLSSSTPIIRLTDTDTNAYGEISSSSSDGNLMFFADQGNTQANTTIRFYVDTTERMRIDASGDMFLGTSSDIAPANGTNLYISDGTISRLGLEKTGANARKFSINNGGTYFSVYDETADAERMRIDSSGNLLVGTSGTNWTTTAGIYAFYQSALNVTRNGAESMNLNRLTSDGTIIGFRKDGTTVGYVGTYGGDLTVGTGDTGVRFIDSLDCIVPISDAAGTSRDAAVDLGYSSIRYKDLYLSGGVYLGGTGSANKLDDYEEGTWTPSILNGWGVTSPTYNSRSGYYTKVGNKVYVVFHMILSGGSLNGNALTITSFPFSIANTGVAESTLNGFFYTASTQDATPMFVMASNGTTGSFVRRTASNRTDFTGTDAGAGFNLSFSGTYTTAS